MSGGSQPKTQTVEQTSEPWPGAQPYLKDVMGQAQSLYRSGTGTQYYPFSTVVPFSPQTDQALSMQEQLAQSNPLLQTATSRVQGEMGLNPTSYVGSGQVGNIAGGGAAYNPSAMASQAAAGTATPEAAAAGGVYGAAAQGGMNSAMRGQIEQAGRAPTQAINAVYGAGAAPNAAAGRLGRFAAPGSRISAADGLDAAARAQSGAAGVYDQAARGQLMNSASFQPFMAPGASPSEQYLSGMAAGGTNPYLEDMYRRGADDLEDRINAQFSSAGRYGSTAHQKALQDGLADMRTNMFGAQYNADQARRLQATGQIQSAYDTGQNRALQATGQQASLNEAGIARQLQGAAGLEGVLSNRFGRLQGAAGLQGQFQGQDLARQLQATGQQAQFGEAQAGRALQAATSAGAMEQGDLARRLGALQASAGIEANDRSRQLQGAGLLQGLGAERMNFGLQGDQALRAAAGQNAQQAMQAAGVASSIEGQRRGQALQAAQMAPGLRAAQFDDPMRLMEVGGVREQLAREQLADAQRRHDFFQTAPWDNLARYSGLVNGMGALGSTSSQTGLNPNYVSPTQRALSGAATGAGILSMLGGTGGAVGGALAKGGLGAALGAVGPLGWGALGLGALAGFM